MTNEVSDLLNALCEGTMNVEDVATRFRRRRWPRRKSHPPANYLELAAAEMQDPEPYLPGSFDEVIEAYETDRLTREQFRILSEAVAEAQRDEDAPGAES